MADLKSWETGSGKAEGEYLRHNVYGDKKEKGVASDTRFWRGEIFYVNDRPWMRYMGHDGNEHLFIHSSKWGFPFDGHWRTELAGVAEFVYTPDLGVFSKYPNDWLTREQTHDRVKLIMLHQIREFAMEEVPGMSGMLIAADYLDWGHGRYVPATDRRTGHGSVNQDKLITGEQMLEARFSRLVDQWIDYSQAFQLRWGPVPQMYEDHYLSVVKAKLKKFLDPKAVRQRERSKAKKLAEKALDLRKK